MSKRKIIRGTAIKYRCPKCLELFSSNSMVKWHFRETGHVGDYNFNGYLC